MKSLRNKVKILALQGGEDNINVSIAKMSSLLEYTKYKIYEKKITQLLRREFKNSIFVSSVKLHERSFDFFKNLNTINDVLNAKELLKEIYFYKETSIAIKISILGTLSKYIEKDDIVFYTDTLKDIFLMEDISNILDIVWFAESAFYYIKKVEPKENQKDSFWIKELDDKSVMIIQNHIEFFYHPALSNSLRFLANPTIHNDDYNLSYIYTVPILINTDEEHKVTINMYYKDDNPLIDMIFILKDETIWTLESLPLANLMQTFLIIFNIYNDKFDARKTYIYKVEDDNINSKIEKIQFRYLRKNDDYYLIFNDKKEYRFDVGETFYMFEKIFLFSTYYFYKSNTVCLKELSGLSNKDFLKSIGLKS
jgi:uncharacterized membrane protein (UPF0127 family)